MAETNASPSPSRKADSKRKDEREAEGWRVMIDEMDTIIRDIGEARERYLAAKAAQSATADEQFERFAALTRDGEGDVDLVEKSLTEIESHPDKFAVSAEEIVRRHTTLSLLKRKIEKAKLEVQDLERQRNRQRRGTSKPSDFAADSRRREIENHDEMIRNELSQQHEIQQQRDEIVDRLAVGVTDLKGKAETIGNIMDDHEKMLTDVDNNMTKVQTKLEGAIQRVGHILDNSSDRGKFCIIAVLLGVLILLVIIIFTGN